MNYERKIQIQWKALYEHGDFQKIEELSKKLEKPVTSKTVAKVFRLLSTTTKQKANENTLEMIGIFYKQKKASQDKLMKQILITEEDGN
jgi:hypothetical protein